MTILNEAQLEAAKRELEPLDIKHSNDLPMSLTQRSRRNELSYAINQWNGYGSVNRKSKMVFRTTPQLYTADRERHLSKATD